MLAALVPPALPPPSLKQGLLARVRGAQTPVPGRLGDHAVDEAAATISPPLRAYQRMVQRLDDVLGSLRDADWARLAAAQWTVQDLVSHLAAADEMLAGWLREPAASAGPAPNPPGRWRSAPGSLAPARSALGLRPRSPSGSHPRSPPRLPLRPRRRLP